MDDELDIDDDDDFVTSASEPQDETNVLEKTIALMEDQQLCLHPNHAHSFQQVNFLVSLRKCAGCDGRLNAVVFGGGANSSVNALMRGNVNNSSQVVKCVACGALAHRSCALSSSISWSNPCPVNTLRLASMGDQSCSGSENEDDDADENDVNDNNDDDYDEVCVESPKKVRTIDSLDSSATSQRSQAMESSFSEQPFEPLDPSEFTWTAEGPPQHWAANANHPFASVSRALQENVVAHFQRTRQSLPEEDTPQKDEGGNDVGEEHDTSTPDTTQDDADAASTVHIPKRLCVATVAGGIAGGVAGIALAGPAGAYAGYKFGQAAGALGVILEGSVSIGVFVASIATAGYTARQVQEMTDKQRVLTMGEDGTSRKVLLVRPNVQIDPIWEGFVDEARKAAPNSSGFYLFSDGKNNQRYRRDADIVAVDEDEIPTHDKVLLLVSRLLNDKTSLPGFVYRSLVQRFHDRCNERDEVVSKNESVAGASPRARRDDAHAVIKHVTATLLDVRPGLGSSPRLTELAAVAVESLVFGELYDCILEEICQETCEKDNSLNERMSDFERIGKPDSDGTTLSKEALASLRMLPEAHSAADKLQYCVKFLEYISSHESNTDAVSADSLLRMACQHILEAKMSNLNAQVAFLEEFARDDQLLKGREGYSLVTLQASMHFLNMSEDFQRDIFEQAETEDNLPMASHE